MNLFKDILGFISTLTLIDFVFFFSVVILIILIVSLIYFIKINDEVFNDSEEKKELLSNIDLEVPTPLIYDENEEDELIDLATLTKQLEEKQSLNIDLTDYEKEQEERAIISYDELLKKTSNREINYEAEEIIDDITVKKVDLANLVSSIEENEPKINVQVISYEKEEAFLQALKQLQQNLN